MKTEQNNICTVCSLDDANSTNERHIHLHQERFFTILDFWLNPFFASIGTYFIWSLPNLVYTIVGWPQTKLMSSFLDVTYRLSIISYYNFKGVA